MHSVLDVEIVDESSVPCFHVFASVRAVGGAVGVNIQVARRGVCWGGGVCSRVEQFGDLVSSACAGSGLRTDLLQHEAGRICAHLVHTEELTAEARNVPSFRWNHRCPPGRICTRDLAHVLVLEHVVVPGLAIVGRTGNLELGATRKHFALLRDARLNLEVSHKARHDSIAGGHTVFVAGEDAEGTGLHRSRGAVVNTARNIQSLDVVARIRGQTGAFDRERHAAEVLRCAEGRFDGSRVRELSLQRLIRLHSCDLAYRTIRGGSLNVKRHDDASRAKSHDDAVCRDAKHRSQRRAELIAHFDQTVALKVDREDGFHCSDREDFPLCYLHAEALEFNVSDSQPVVLVAFPVGVGPVLLGDRENPALVFVPLHVRLCVQIVPKHLADVAVLPNLSLERARRKTPLPALELPAFRTQGLQGHRARNRVRAHCLPRLEVVLQSHSVLCGCSVRLCRALDQAAGCRVPVVVPAVLGVLEFNLLSATQAVEGIFCQLARTGRRRICRAVAVRDAIAVFVRWVQAARFNVDAVIGSARDIRALAAVEGAIRHAHVLTHVKVFFAASEHAHVPSRTTASLLGACNLKATSTRCRLTRASLKSGAPERVFRAHVLACSVLTLIRSPDGIKRRVPRYAVRRLVIWGAEGARAGRGVASAHLPADPVVTQLTLEVARVTHLASAP